MTNLDWGCGPRVEHLPGMHEALGSVLGIPQDHRGKRWRAEDGHGEEGGRSLLPPNHGYGKEARHGVTTVQSYREAVIATSSAGFSTNRILRANHFLSSLGFYEHPGAGQACSYTEHYAEQTSEL